MSLADDMRAMLREDALPDFVPEVANFERVRELGGTKNHLGELEPERFERIPLFAIETTGRGELDDRERTERNVGGQIQGELVIMLLDDLLEHGDRVERIEDGTPYKVVSIESPRLNGAVVSYNVRIREQTD